MEAISAVRSNPLSVFGDRRTETRKISSLHIVSAHNVSNSSSISTKFPTLQQGLSAGLRGGLLLVASLVSTGFARAWTYEEALQQSVSADLFDANEVVDTIVSFGVENPTIIAGGVAVLAVPLVVSQFLKKTKPWGVESAKIAYAKLGEDSSAQLLDIRGSEEFRQVGSPDIKGLSKKAVSIAYKGDDKTRFLKRLSSKFQEPENITLFILDKLGGNSELVAELVTINGFKAAYAIKDGAEGPRGWNSGLPWIAPKKGLSFDFSSLSDSIGDAVGDVSDGASLALGVAAATGLSLLAFTEVETILQVLGSLAILQFASKKLLFAKKRSECNRILMRSLGDSSAKSAQKDRKQTLQQVDEFLNSKVAPKELVDEMKQIGKALLPSTVSSKALQASSVENPDAIATSNTVLKAEATLEAAAASAPEINSVPKADVREKSLKPLSPYPSYPDWKPPASPSPSQP